MMYGAVHKLAIVLITFHVVGGCCLHHAHAQHEEAAGVSTACVEPHGVLPGHSCPTCLGAPGSPISPCHEGRCQYLAPEKVRVGARPALMPSIALAGDGPRDDARIRCVRMEGWHAAAGGVWHGLRLHLIHEVFLL